MSTEPDATAVYPYEQVPRATGFEYALPFFAHLMWLRYNNEYQWVIPKR
jgi:hypothetical protein